MNRQDLTTPKPYQLAGLAGLALMASALVAIGVLYAVRRRAGSPTSTTAEGGEQPSSRVPIQPAVETVAPAEVPHHFSESLVVPGFTETGMDIERRDDSDGRSPGGV